MQAKTLATIVQAIVEDGTAKVNDDNFTGNSDYVQQDTEAWITYFTSRVILDNNGLRPMFTENYPLSFETRVQINAALNGRHQFNPGSSGRACVALYVDYMGTGDTCDLAPDDGVHHLHSITAYHKRTGAIVGNFETGDPREIGPWRAGFSAGYGKDYTFEVSSPKA